MFKFLKKVRYGWGSSLQWYFVNGILSKFPSRHIRFFFLRKLGAKIGINVSLFSGFHIRNPKGIVIGNGCSIGPKVLLDGRKGLEIGNNVTIAYEAIIWSLNHDYNDPKFRGVGEKVIIEEYAWVCSRSIILPGIKIGKGAIVASGAVVTKNIGDFEIWGGVPAKFLGYREKSDYSYVPGKSYAHII